MFVKLIEIYYLKRLTPVTSRAILYIEDDTRTPGTTAQADRHKTPAKLLDKAIALRPCWSFRPAGGKINGNIEGPGTENLDIGQQRSI